MQSDDPRDGDEQDSSLGPALWSVAVAGALVTLTSPALFGAMGVVSVGVGAALALSNLWLIGRTVRAFLGTSGSRPSWALVAVLKFAGLFLLLTAAVRHGVIELLPLGFGYAALPLGIVLSQFRASAPVRGEG